MDKIVNTLLELAREKAREFVEDAFSTENETKARDAVDDLFDKVDSLLNGTSEANAPVDKEVSYQSMLDDIATHREVTRGLQFPSAWRTQRDRDPEGNQYRDTVRVWESLPDEFKHTGQRTYVTTEEWQNRDLFNSNPWDNIF